MIWKKQLRTTIFLLILIAGLVGGGYYVRNPAQAPVVLSSNAAPVLQGVDDAVKRYESRTPEDKAQLRSSADDGIQQKAELVFEGLSDESATQSLLDALKQNGLAAAFYVTGEEASARAKSLSMITGAGYTVGIAFTEAAYAMDAAAATRVLSAFVRTSAAIQTVAGVWPSQILSLSTPSDDLLAVAFACSMDKVIVPTRVVSLKEAASTELAQQLVDSLARKSILCVKLGESEPDAATGFPALCAALAATDLGARAETLTSTDTTTTEPLKRVYTSERAVAFTFSGLGNQTELDGVLSALKAVNGVATFFVTIDDLTRYPEEIHQIISAGHSLGLAVQASRFSSASALLDELFQTRETVQVTFGYTGELAVRPAFGTASKLLAQACSAGGFTLLSAMVNAVRTEDIRATSAADLLDQLLPASNGVLQRGEIVHFQMNQYQKSNQLLGDLVKLIASQRNIYPPEARDRYGQEHRCRFTSTPCPPPPSCPR